MTEREQFTTRVLMSLIVDVVAMAETAERLKVQVFLLAKEHKIKIPAAAS